MTRTMLIVPRLAAYVVFLGALAGWANEARSADFQIERVPAGLIFQGRISQQAVAQLSTALRIGDTLLIGSEIGDPAAGLALGNLVLDRDVMVAVNGECLNICASYVFLPARRRRVTLGYSVRFGGSPFLEEELLNRSHDTKASVEARQAAELSDRYRLLLARSGVSPRILECIDYAARSNLTARQSGQGFSAITLSKGVFATFGVAVSGKFVWNLDKSFRQEFSSLTRQGIIWVDQPEQCSPPS